MKQSRIDWLPSKLPRPGGWISWMSLKQKSLSSPPVFGFLLVIPTDCWTVDSLAFSGLFILWVETMSDFHHLRPHLHSLAKGEEALHFSSSTHNSSALLCLVLVFYCLLLYCQHFLYCPYFPLSQFQFFLFTPVLEHCRVIPSVVWTKASVIVIALSRILQQKIMLVTVILFLSD